MVDSRSNQSEAAVVQEEEYRERYGFSDTFEYAFKSRKGLDEDIVREISRIKGEPEWMLEKRLAGYKQFKLEPTPQWGADLNNIDYDDIYYYLNPTNKKSDSWDAVPEEIKRTFDRLGIPEAERKFFAGAEAQYDSEVVYSHIKETLEKDGVIFISTDEAVKRYPEIVKRYFGTVVPPTDNKFAALNTAVWSGGSYIFVPKGVKVEMPLQAYFRINTEKAGQFERTLIIADEGADVTYVEGCFTAGTEIVTREGLKPIEGIKIGDEVLTHNGRYMKVYHAQVRSYNGKLFTIEYYGDTSKKIEVTDEHPFLVARRKRNEYKNKIWEIEWVRADKIDKYDYLAIPIDRNTISKDEREFEIKMKTRWHEIVSKLPIKTDDDFFRLVGYYLSEGSVGGQLGDNYLVFTFNKSEMGYIFDAASLLERYFDKKPSVQKEYKNGIGIVLSSTVAAKFFKEQFGKGAENKHMPEWVLHEDIEKQKELIRGMWRGDGSFMNKNYVVGAKRMFRINTISKVLARQLRNVLLRLNIFSSINVQIRDGPRKNMYCIYIGGENLNWFANLMSFDIKEEIEVGDMKMLSASSFVRTTSSYAQIVGDYAFVPIKDISSREVQNLNVYNFSVQEDESYVANGVAVHNCTAPIYMSSSLHAAVVEIVAKKNAHVRYITIQNWSKNVYNLVTQRAFAYENAFVEWIDTNIGSRANMKYPSVFLKERGARGSVLSVAVAGQNQVQDSGGKIYHLAPDTTSQIISKGVSAGNGMTTYRGLLHVDRNATNAKSTVRCEALLLDEESKTNTFPYMEIDRDDATIMHEASTGKVGEKELFYLMSRGLSEEEALTTIVLGFLDLLARALPLEYSLELKRLVKLDMSKSVG